MCSRETGLVVQFELKNCERGNQFWPNKTQLLRASTISHILCVFRFINLPFNVSWQYELQYHIPVSQRQWARLCRTFFSSVCPSFLSEFISLRYILNCFNLFSTIFLTIVVPKQIIDYGYSQLNYIYSEH